MLFYGLLWVLAIIANLKYSAYCRTSKDLAEYRLVLRRAWIPGYLAYHDGLFATASETDIKQIDISLSRIALELNEFNSCLRTWGAKLPRHNLRIVLYPPSFFENPNIYGVIDTVIVIGVLGCVVALWYALALVAIFDQYNFYCRHHLQPTLYTS